MTATPVRTPPPILGQEVAAIEALGKHVAAGRHAEAMAILRPTVERVLFRFAGVAVSGWFAVGMPDAASLPIRRADGSVPAALTMGNATDLLTFCGPHTPLIPQGKLVLPRVQRLREAIDAIATAARNEEGSPLDLRAVAAAAGPPSRKGVALHAAFAEFVRVRNLEAHHAGRAQLWPDEQPDYAGIMASVHREALHEIVTHPALDTLDGLAVAVIVDISPSGRSRTPLITLALDVPGEPRVYHRGAAEGAQVGGRWVVRQGRDPSQVELVMAFIDVASGPPRHPVTGEPFA